MHPQYAKASFKIFQKMSNSDYADVQHVMSNPKTDALWAEIISLSPSQLKRSLEDVGLSTQGYDLQLRLRLLRFRKQQDCPDVEEPRYPKDEVPSRKELDRRGEVIRRLEEIYMRDQNKLEDGVKPKRKTNREQRASGADREAKDQHTHPDVMEGNVRKLNKLSIDDNGTTRKKDRPDYKRSSNKIIQDDLWSDVSESSHEYDDDKRSFRSYRDDFYDRYDDAGYRKTCLDLLKSWNLKYHGMKGAEASDFLGYLSDFRRFAKISDEILLDMLPTIFDSKTRMWYRTTIFTTWGEFETSFFSEFVAGYRPKARSVPSQPNNPSTLSQNQSKMPPQNNLSGTSWTLPQVPLPPMYPQFNPVSGMYSFNHPDYKSYY